MANAQALRTLLQKIDHKGYPAYKDTKGNYEFDGFTLSIDHVQGDPFASPSDLSVHIQGKLAAFPVCTYNTREKRIALQDHLLRVFGKSIAAMDRVAKGSGKSGRVFITRPGQEILDRSACQIYPKDGSIIMRFQVGFPANGRTINSRELIRVFFDILPQCVGKTLFYNRYSRGQKDAVERVRALSEDQTALRSMLKDVGMIAFVANGAILPRESGASSLPMKNAVAFQSPESMEVEFTLPNHGSIRGMGIRKGITLIVGGGYHGKSTLLDALELGVYDHIAGDGREFVICEDTALKSRAEDGRPVHDVNIACFIRNLPNGKDTCHFSTEDASGSTSQAAGMTEGISAGATVLLLDEDTSATNFMIRDRLMQRVVHADEEPIIPFIDRVRELYEKQGISTILVAGSSGAYFYVADTIIQMREYHPYDITEMAKAEALAAQQKPVESIPISGAGKSYFPIDEGKRILHKNRIFDNPRTKIRTNGMNSISVDHNEIDLRLVEQLVDEEQMNALGAILRYTYQKLADERLTVQQILDRIERLLDEKGMDAIGTHGLARPRKLEIAACLNRFRG